MPCFTQDNDEDLGKGFSSLGPLKERRGGGSDLMQGCGRQLDFLWWSQQSEASTKQSNVMECRWGEDITTRTWERFSLRWDRSRSVEVGVALLTVALLTVRRAKEADETQAKSLAGDLQKRVVKLQRK
jgi:hypothetical protein